VLLAGLWIFVSLLWPEGKLSLGLLGGSPGSTTSGANPTYAECGAFFLAAWALAVPGLRRRIPLAVAGVAAGWILIVALAGLRGWLAGHALRDVFAEARIIALSPALLALATLDAAGRRVAWKALAAGIAAWSLWQAALIWAEPTGFCSMDIVPIAITASQHATDVLWLAALGAIQAGLWLPAWPGLALAGGAWVLLWLSLIRSLWLAVPLGALAAAGMLCFGSQRPRAVRFAALQALALALGLACTILVHGVRSPDGIFLLEFRLQRMAQGLHLAPAPAQNPDTGDRSSALFRAIVRRGGLYRSLDASPADPSIASQRAVDPSLDQRRGMRSLALRAFRSSPLLGQGLGLVFQVPTTTGFLATRDPHSGLAWFLSKMGLLGSGFAAACLAWLALALWRRRALASGVSAALAGSLVMALSLELVQPGILHAGVWLPLAVLGQVLREPGQA
jgi:hypothetical protein